jgi:translocation and assembly module TamB
MIWLKRVSLGLLALILLLIIAIASLLYTSAGVKIAVWGAMKALPALSVESSNGALLKGFQLNNIQYKDDIVDLSADNVNLTLDDNCLLMPEICVTELGLTGLRFTMPELPPSQPDIAAEPEAAPITEIVMPLPIRIDRVRFDDIVLDILGNKVAWKQFSTAAELEGSHLTLKPTDWQGIDLTLAPAPEVDSSEPIESVADSPVQPIVLPEVILPMSFNIECFTIKDFKLNGDTPQAVDLLELVATANGSDIDVSKLALVVPQAKLDATANITLTGDYPLVLDAVTDIALEPLQGHNLTLKASGSLAKLTLDASLKGTIDAILAGDLSPLDPKLPFNLAMSSQHIQWPIDTKAEFEVENTALNAEGSLDGFTFNVQSKIDGDPMPAVALNLTGDGDLNKVTLTSLKVDTLGGSITGNANANWKDTVKWQGQLDFSHIQPGIEWPDAQGDLSGTLRTSGGLTKQGGWFVSLPELAIDGVIMDQAFTLNGQLDADDKSGKGNVQLETDGLNLKHGPNGLTAKGKLTKEWAMSAQVDAPDLAQSLPGLRGRVQGHVNLSGKMAEPIIDLALSGNTLGWQEQAALESFELVGEVTPAPQLKADIRLNAQKGTFDTFKLNDLNLTFRGTEDAHKLLLDLNADPVSADLALTGKLDRSTGWQGLLNQAQIETPVGPWTLNKPTALGYNLKTALANVAAHCWQQDKSSLCLVESLEAGASGHAKVAVNNFDFDLLKPFIPEETVLKGEMGANLEATWAPKSSPYVKAQIKLPSGSVSQQMTNDEDPLIVGWDSISLNAEVKNDVLNADWLVAVKNNGDLSGKATITQLTSDQQLNANVKIDRFTLGFLEPVIKDYHKFGGQIDTNLTVTGPINHPAINGLFKVTKVTATGRKVPLDVTNADITVAFSGYNATLQGNVDTPDGKLLIRGSGDWQDMAAWKTELHVNGKELQVSAPPMVALKVSPDLTISVSPRRAEITGNIGIPWGRINVKQLPKSAVSVSDDEVILGDNLKPVKEEESIPFDLKTNVLVKIGDDVKLSAFGLKAGLIGELSIRQEGKVPLIYGEVNITRGSSYRSFGQELVIRKGQILFNGPADQPYLSIEAIRDPDNIEDDVIAGLRVTGPADEPKVDIFSDPAMPQQNALSYILQGKDIDSEGGDNNNAMTTALIGMGLAQSGQLVGDVGKAVGVQDLSVSTAGSGDDSQVTIGGYIAPGLQVKYGVGIFDSIGEFTVRYRLMTDLYVEAVSGLDSAVDLLYQFEFN